MYDKNPNKETLAEEILCEMLQFLQFKIRNHKLTVADSEAIHRIFDTLNMIASDNYGLIERWFPGEEGSDKDRRFVTMAVNWLNDPDSQHKDCKIWCYLNE